MKNIVREPICLLIITLCAIWPAQGQAPFQNLDFSAAQIPPGTTNGSFLPVSQLLPGWSAYIGSVQENAIGYNMIYLDAAGVTLVGPGGNVALPPGNSYTAVMQASYGFSGMLVPTSIVQTGLIPVTAMSLVFEANFNAGEWAVTIGGQNLPVTQQAITGSYVVYAGNISAYAGKTEQLQFTALAGQSVAGFFSLANISFSTKRGSR